MKIAALRCETRKLGPINADRSKSDVIRMYIHLELDCMEATGQQRPHREEKACGSMRAWEGAAGEGGGPGGSAAGCPASDRVRPSFLTALRHPRSSGRLLCSRPEGSSRGGAGTKFVGKGHVGFRNGQDANCSHKSKFIFLKLTFKCIFIYQSRRFLCFFLRKSRLVFFSPPFFANVCRGHDIDVPC